MLACGPVCVFTDRRTVLGDCLDQGRNLKVLDCTRLQTFTSMKRVLVYIAFSLVLCFPPQTEEFCTYHGLSVKGGCVNFARSSFIEPETRFPMKRALKLIESKRNHSIGEVSPSLSKVDPTLGRTMSCFVWRVFRWVWKVVRLSFSLHSQSGRILIPGSYCSVHHTA